MQNNKEAKKPNLMQIGEPGLKRDSTGNVYEEWITDLKSDRGKKKKAEMERHILISSSMRVLESLCRRAVWSTEPNASKSMLAQEAADFVQSCFEDMTHTWQQTLSEILSSVFWGWAVMEPTYKIRKGDYKEPILKSNFTDGRIGWRDWGPRAQSSLYKWHFSDNGEVLGFYQQPPCDYKIRYLPIDRILLFSFRSRKGNPEGCGLAESVYEPWYYEKKLREIEAIGVERNVAGLPVMQVPIEIAHPNANAANQATRDKYADLVKKIRNDAYMGLVIPSETKDNGNPSGFKFGLLSASGRNFAETDTIIKRYGHEILFAFETEYKLLGMDRVGALSTSSDKTGMLSYTIAMILDGAEEIINQQAIPRLMRLNQYPVDAWPKWKHGDVEKRDIAQVASALTQAVTAGVMTADDDVENMMRSLFDLDPKEQREFHGAMEANTDPDAQNIDPVDVPNPTEEPTQENPSLSLQEASAYLGIGRSAIVNALRSGQLPGARIGRSWRIVKSDLDQYMRGGYGA